MAQVNLPFELITYHGDSITGNTTVLTSHGWVNSLTQNNSAYSSYVKDGKSWFKYAELFEYSSSGDLVILSSDMEAVVEQFIKVFKNTLDNLIAEAVKNQTATLEKLRWDANDLAEKTSKKNKELEVENKEIHKVLNSNRFSDI